MELWTEENRNTREAKQTNSTDSVLNYGAAGSLKNILKDDSLSFTDLYWPFQEARCSVSEPKTLLSNIIPLNIA